MYKNFLIYKQTFAVSDIYIEKKKDTENKIWWKESGADNSPPWRLRGMRAECI